MGAIGSYDQDFYAWTQEQAAALRRVPELRLNLPGVDVDHLAEEIADMGNDTLAKIEGLVVQIIVHLLKLEFCPDREPRRHWSGEITEWRTTVRRRARRSPSVLDRIDLEEAMADAGLILLRRHGDQAWVADLPAACPYTLSQVLDPAYLPVNRWGLGE